jgi:hypothetical protein
MNICKEVKDQLQTKQDVLEFILSIADSCDGLESDTILYTYIKEIRDFSEYGLSLSK